MATMRVAVVSPEQEVWSGEAELVVARTLDGELGVMPGPVPPIPPGPNGPIPAI